MLRLAAPFLALAGFVACILLASESNALATVYAIALLMLVTLYPLSLISSRTFAKKKVGILVSFVALD